jgi:hypothetical protein
MVKVDAGSFQEPLARLADTMVQKVFLEGSQHLRAPSLVGENIAIMIRHALSTYQLLFYLNADERRKNDLDWKDTYGVAAMPLVRSLIDCLYNMTSILQNPVERGAAYHKSGIKKTLIDLDEDHRRYRGQPQWEAYVNERRAAVEVFIRISGFTRDEVMKAQIWPTLGRYISPRKRGDALTEHQEFLKTFTHMGWRQYSALSHGAYEGFIGFVGPIPVGAYYTRDFLPHAERPKIDASYDMYLSSHIARAATVMLCMITELQAYCRFEGANINERISTLWKALIPLFEAKELYEGRYLQLMKARGIVQE